MEKDKDLDPNEVQAANVSSSDVGFHLDESENLDAFDESLDEVDEFLELSTMSNPPYTSSFDSTNNASMTNSKLSSTNDLNHEKKSVPKQYSR